MTKRRKKILGLPIGPPQPSLASRLAKPAAAVVGAGVGVLVSRRVLQSYLRGASVTHANGDPSAQARSVRADLQRKLKTGELDLEEALRQGEADEAIGRTRVKILLQNLPGVGPRGAVLAMDELGIDQNRRIKGLGSRQREALIERFAGGNDSKH